MSPSLNAQCMRSSVTISLIVDHQQDGFQTTAHGAHIPTKMECRHEKSVCLVQSAVRMLESPFRVQIRSYSSIDSNFG